MSLSIPARPTTYKGIQMRSRLEARFAAELDDEGTGWVYEPRAYANQRGQYLPDFQLVWWDGEPITQPTFVEVRPTIVGAYRAMSEMTVIWDSEPRALLMIAVPDLSLWWYRVADLPSWRISP